MVSISLERKGVQLTWDPGEHAGEVQLFFVRGDDMSHTDPRANDGDALVSVPADFEGTTTCEVRDLEGNVIDSGDITI